MLITLKHKSSVLMNLLQARDSVLYPVPPCIKKLLRCLQTLLFGLFFHFRSHPVLCRLHWLFYSHGSGRLVSTLVCWPAFSVGGCPSSRLTGQLWTRMGWSRTHSTYLDPSLYIVQDFFLLYYLLHQMTTLSIFSDMDMLLDTWHAKICLYAPFFLLYFY